MDNLYIIISFHLATSIYNGKGYAQLYSLSFNGEQVQMGHFDEIDKILDFKISKCCYKEYTHNILFEFKSIIKIINIILRIGKYNIVSISEDKISTITYHLVKSTVKSY